MFFLQASMAPIKVRIGQLHLTIEKYTLDDAVAWGQQLHEAAIAKAVKDMDEVKRREYMLYYAPAGLDLQSLKAELRTPAGIKEVLKTCLLTKTKVTDEQGTPQPELSVSQINKILELNGTGRLAGLAYVLADVDESALGVKPEERDIDPLFSTATPASTGSRETGQKTTRHSPPHIQEEIPADSL